MKCGRLFAAMAAAMAAGVASSDELRCLTEEVAGGPPTDVAARYWAGRMARASAVIVDEARRLDSSEMLAAWQRRVRSEFRRALGTMPKPTPLNARTVRAIDRQGYRVEIVLFESRPLHHVTAALFLPDAARFRPPYPGILIPCGHSREPRRRPDSYVRACAMAALNGMAALIYDPIDQGERLQVITEAGQTPEWGVQGHNRLGSLAILVGWNTASFRVWDGVRALDYLAGRPEVDPSRLGCMGVSGGGTMTSLLMTFDERIQAAAPACYISSLARVYEAIGPQDAEQNVFGQMRFGLEHAGYLLARAPMPVMVCARTQDFFPIGGTRASVEQARSVLARMGWADRLGLTIDEGKHDWSETHLRTSVRWMRQWLRGEDELHVPPEDETGPTGRRRQPPRAGR